MQAQVSSTRKLISAGAIMAAGTMISRVLGLARVMLVAFILGNGTRQADILAVASLIPNSIYFLFAGGALNAVLVPQIVRAIKNDPDGGEAYTNRIMTAFMLVVTAVTLTVMIAAPLLTSVYASGYRTPELAAQFASMVALTYLTLPQIFFYGAFFLLSQVLNAKDRFGPMMWAPIANNVISVLVLGIYLLVWGTSGDRSAAFDTPQIWLLGLGSTLGIVTQTLVLIPFLKQIGFKLRPRFDLKGTGLGKTFSLAKWTLGFLVVSQLVLVLVTNLSTSATASGAGAGTNAYNNAYLVWVLPHSLITVSLATAMLPNASRLAAAGDLAGVSKEAQQTLRLALVALVPAAIGYICLAGPIAGLLFGHGKGQADAWFVSWALLAFALGLVPFTVQFICLRIFYSLENTRTPFFLQCLTASCNAGVAVLLVWLATNPNWIAAALALAYSVSCLVGALVSWQALKRKLPGLAGRSIVMHILRLGIAAGAGGVAAYYCSVWVLKVLPHPVWGNLVAILAGLTLIAGSFVLLGKLLQVRELRDLTHLISSRFQRSNSAQKTGSKQAAPALVDDLHVTEVTGTFILEREPRDLLTEDLMPTQLNPKVELGQAADVEFSRVNSDPSQPTWTSTPSAATSPAEVDPQLATELPPDTPELNPVAVGTAGMLLNTRFRIDQLLTSRFGVETWRAHDLVLSRDVTAHLISQDNPRLTEILEAARKGAIATDSRFLRVLDAVQAEPNQVGIGGYVVSEFAPGKSLTELLTQGPLSALESAFVIRELAEALTGMHAQGLFHEALNPDNVVITTSGAVRLVGFGLESAIANRTNQPDSWASRETEDVKGLAKLLYATLVQRWPGGPDYGLEAAPIIAGEPAAPHTAQLGVSPALDRICSVTLTERGMAAESRITTAAQLATALRNVLGTADGSTDLEYRVRHLVVPRRLENTSELAAAPVAAATAQPPSLSSAVGVEPASLVAAAPASQTRPVFRLVAILAVTVLLISLAVVALQNARDNGTGKQQSNSSSSQATDSNSATGSPSSSLTPGTVYKIVSGKDFDPKADGGDAEENSTKVNLAFDGDPATGWSTSRYRNRPNLGGLKPGVGLVLDLGEVRSIAAVELSFADAGQDVELRIPKQSSASQAPMESQSAWQVIASRADAPKQTVLKPTTAAKSRFVLVYLTSLPKVATARFEATINEIKVTA